LTDDPCLETLRVLGHELRRPLTVIRGASTLLIDDSDALPAGSRQQMLGMIDRSAAGMSDMIDDLLTAVHLELGDVLYSTEALDVAALIADAVEAARYEDPERGVDVSGLNGLEVEADRDHAVRALRALLVNAIRYSPEGGAVEVVASTDADAVSLQVLDRGPGIPAAQREHAFEKFSRLDPNTGGAGLGLFLARGLARGMGGEVTLDEREDGGTAVCFTLRRRG
jgi:two-component system, OmpR family, sensor histidine kinase KdpD